jgi:hypothetical protein
MVSKFEFLRQKDGKVSLENTAPEQPVQQPIEEKKKPALFGKIFGGKKKEPEPIMPEVPRPPQENPKFEPDLQAGYEATHKHYPEPTLDRLPEYQQPIAQQPYQQPAQQQYAQAPQSNMPQQAYIQQLTAPVQQAGFPQQYNQPYQYQQPMPPPPDPRPLQFRINFIGSSEALVIEVSEQEALMLQETFTELVRERKMITIGDKLINSNTITYCEVMEK